MKQCRVKIQELMESGRRWLNIICNYCPVIILCSCFPLITFRPDIDSFSPPSCISRHYQSLVVYAFREFFHFPSTVYQTISPKHRPFDYISNQTIFCRQKHQTTITIGQSVVYHNIILTRLIDRIVTTNSQLDLMQVFGRLSTFWP